MDDAFNIILFLSAVALRFACALATYGYVHPDEYHQSNEIAARDVFNVSANVAWEFRSEAPARSIIGVWLTSGIPYAASRALGLSASAVAVAAPRVFACAASWTTDAAVISCARAIGANAREAWMMFITSWVVLVILVRPFSNSVETFAMAVCALVATHRVGGRGSDVARCAAIGAIGCVGVFVRFTSAVYIAPWAVFAVMRAREKSLGNAVAGALSGVSAACVVAVACVVADTAYFRGVHVTDAFAWNPKNWIVTPWNSFSYNARAENLALHGLHPRYLHAVVNGPIMFGPLWFSFFRDTLFVSQRKASTSSPRDALLVHALQASVLVPLLALSFAPHQEPRFLTPMTFPMCVLAALHPTEKLRSRCRRGFFALWIAFNAILTCLFGILHQGGVVPATQALANIDTFNGSPRANAIFWKTYMPPRSVLAQELGHDRITITDVAGASVEDMRELLSSTDAGECSVDIDSCVDRATILIAPALAFERLREITADDVDFELAFERFPHLSLDHLDEVGERLSASKPAERIGLLRRALFLTAHVARKKK